MSDKSISLDSNITKDQFELIKYLNLFKVYPIQFGGSLALTCYGVINRPIGDIDIITTYSGKGVIKKLIQTNLNAKNHILRSGGSLQCMDDVESFKTDFGKLCIFCSDYIFQSSNYDCTNPFTIYYGDEELDIELCPIDVIIDAKKRYCSNINVKVKTFAKHVDDLKLYKSWKTLNKLQSTLKLLYQNGGTEFELDIVLKLIFKHKNSYLNSDDLNVLNKLITEYNRVKNIFQ